MCLVKSVLEVCPAFISGRLVFHSGVIGGHLIVVLLLGVSLIFLFGIGLSCIRGDSRRTWAVSVGEVSNSGFGG